MKTLHIVLINFLLILSSCSQQSNKVINSQDLAGTYTAELGPLWEQILERSAKTNNADRDFEIAQKMASMFLSSISIQISFNDNNHGLYEINGVGLDLLNALAEVPGITPTEFEYEIRNDSVLYIRFINEPSQMDFEPAGVLEKVDGYRHIKLHIKDCGELDMYKKSTKI